MGLVNPGGAHGLDIEFGQGMNFLPQASGTGGHVHGDHLGARARNLLRQQIALRNQQVRLALKWNDGAKFGQ